MPNAMRRNLFIRLLYSPKVARQKLGGGFEVFGSDFDGAAELDRHGTERKRESFAVPGTAQKALARRVKLHRDERGSRLRRHVKRPFPEHLRRAGRTIGIDVRAPTVLQVL